MAQNCNIEWTNASWNPVTGCTGISAGCKNCYARTIAERFRGIPGHPYENGFDLRLWPNRLGIPLSWKKPRRILVNSMSDLFHEKVPFKFVDQVFRTMRVAKWHQFQILTKRPERMKAYLDRRVDKWGSLEKSSPHIWLGTSVESEEYIFRAEILASIPCAVRFLSCEPLLGPLDLSHILGQVLINWVIVGGESGMRARPMKKSWVNDIRKQCCDAGIPFFFKQWGGKNKKAAGRRLANRTWDEFPTESPNDQLMLFEKVG